MIQALGLDVKKARSTTEHSPSIEDKRKGRTTAQVMDEIRRREQERKSIRDMVHAER